MARSNNRSNCRGKRCRKSKTRKISSEEVHLTAFLNIKNTYVPGEQILLSYVIDDTYTMNPGDSIELQRCGYTTSHKRNPSRWPVSTVPANSRYSTYLALPIPDCKQKNDEYQFIYISHKSGKVIGRSQNFKIDEISAIEEGHETEEAEIEATPPVHTGDKETFSELITRKRSRSVSTDSVSSSTGSVEQYDRKYGIPRSIRPNGNCLESCLTTTNSEFPVTLGQVARVPRKLGEDVSRRATLDILADDNVFMDSFLFPFINGVLEFLKKDGYSAIICRDSEAIQLANSGQKTLDLRQGWSKNKDLAMKAQLLDLPITSMDDLIDLYHQLEEDFESFKHESEVRESRYVGELKKSHVKDMRTVNSRIRRLERQMRMLLSSSRSRVRTHQHDRLQPNCGELDTGKDVPNVEISNLKSINEVLTAHIAALERKLAEKSAELGLLYQQLLEHQTQQKEPSDTTRAARGKCKEESGLKSSGAQRPPIQKATSDGATSAVDSEKSSLNTEKKQTTTSERKLAVLSTDQENWLHLLQRLLVNDRSINTQKVDDPTIHECKSSDSLAVAMRRLFNICSSQSLASTTPSQHSLQTSDSVLEAIRQMFASETSLSKQKKVNSYPATTCNSADNVSEHSKPRKADQSTSMKDALRWLLTVSSEDLKKALPGASDDSLTSLGEAMRNLFNEEVEQEEKKEALSTSNESLSQAMHLLFDNLSQSSLSEQKLTNSKSSTGSLESVLWRLTDPTPDEYRNMDIKEYNLRKQKQKTCTEGNQERCKCSLRNYFTSGSRKNPSLSSVIRSSSPDDNVNICHPSKGHHSSEQSETSHAIKTTLPSTSYSPKQNCADGGNIFAESELENEFKLSEDLLSSNSRGRSRSKRAKNARASKMAKKVCPYCHQSVFNIRQHLQIAHRRLL